MERWSVRVGSWLRPRVVHALRARQDYKLASLAAFGRSPRENNSPVFSSWIKHEGAARTCLRWQTVAWKPIMHFDVIILYEVKADTSLTLTRNWRQCLCKILEWSRKSIMICYGIFCSGQLIAKRTSRWPCDALTSGGINFEDSINQHPNKVNFVTQGGEAKEVS